MRTYACTDAMIFVYLFCMTVVYVCLYYCILSPSCFAAFLAMSLLEKFSKLLYIYIYTWYKNTQSESGVYNELQPVSGEFENKTTEWEEEKYCFIPNSRSLGLFRSYHVWAHCSASDRLHASSMQSDEEEWLENKSVCSWAPHLCCDKLKHSFSM